MKIAYLSDIHTDAKINLKFLEPVILEIKKADPDIFILAGDITHKINILLQTLQLFDTILCPKLAIPGNHDIWSTTEITSFQKHEKILPEIFSQFGWHWLPGNPYKLSELAIVGTMGWYDYSFRHKKADISLQTYRSKRHGDFVWMDGVYGKWEKNEKKWSDSEILDWLLEIAEKDILSVKDFQTIVFVSHHIPLEDILYQNLPITKYSFLRAYMGSEKIGHLILKYPGIKYVICGHRHIATNTKVGKIKCYSNPLGYPRERNLFNFPSCYAKIVEIKNV
ncbi:MAG: metallophosphoesterase [Leptospiraceae bacterium]|nr:metallophosphoesterase [Leptospiraceae bacterium]MCP5497518.1 metallophosphoesterase [Leptospiraceae bacterium]